MQEFFIVAIIFGTIAFVIKVLSDNRIRSRILDNAKIEGNEKQALIKLEGPANKPLQSVKWGLVLIAIGLALTIGNMFPYQVSEEMTFGLGFLFAGLAFLIYYFIAKRMSETDE